jgi:hypothetical protein
MELTSLLVGFRYIHRMFSYFKILYFAQCVCLCVSYDSQNTQRLSQNSINKAVFVTKALYFSLLEELQF